MADGWRPVAHHLHCHARGALVRAPGRTAGEISLSPHLVVGCRFSSQPCVTGPWWHEHSAVGANLQKEQVNAESLLKCLTLVNLESPF